MSFLAQFGTRFSPECPKFATGKDKHLKYSIMELKLTEMLLQASIGTALHERVCQLAEFVKKHIKQRSSLKRLKELEEFSKDSELTRFAVETFKAQNRLPTLAERDYKAYMMLIACSPEDFAFRYLSNDITAVYVDQRLTKELLFFCDLLHTMKGRSYLNCVINRVSDYFFCERRNLLYDKPTHLKECEIQHAESRLPGLARAVFRLKVDVYSYRTFVAKEMAELCGMSYSLFRSRFRNYFGISATEWLREERISRIKTDMTYRPELSIKEVATRNTFASASNFADFCNQQLKKSPTELQKECYDIWKEKRLAYWNEN